jgi:hypothetical protein
MRYILKGCAFPDDIPEQHIIGVHVGASLDRRDHRHADVGDVLQSLMFCWFLMKVEPLRDECAHHALNHLVVTVWPNFRGVP